MHQLNICVNLLHLRTDSSDLKTKPGKRRWFRFRLRTLLVLTAVLCAWLGWLMHGINKQRRAVAVLERSGAQVGLLSFSAFPPWTSILSRYRRIRLDLALPVDLKRVTLTRTPIAETDMPFLDGVFRGLRTTVELGPPLNKFRDQAIQEASKADSGSDPMIAPTRQ